MPKIVKSDKAPEGEISVSFGPVSFSLGGDSSEYVTDDVAVAEQAAAHKWLTVQADEPVVSSGTTTLVNTTNSGQNVPAVNDSSVKVGKR